MAVFLLQGAQDVLKQQGEGGRQGPKSLRHLGGKDGQVLSMEGGGAVQSPRGDRVARSTAEGNEKVERKVGVRQRQGTGDQRQQKGERWCLVLIFNLTESRAT